MRERERCNGRVVKLPVRDRERCSGRVAKLPVRPNERGGKPVRSAWLPVRCKSRRGLGIGSGMSRSSLILAVRGVAWHGVRVRVRSFVF